MAAEGTETSLSVRCSCYNCDSLACFARRHDAMNRCRCENCVGSKTCLFFTNKYENMYEKAAQEIPSKDNGPNVIADAKYCSSISTKLKVVTTADVSERISTTVQTKESRLKDIACKEAIKNGNSIVIDDLLLSSSLRDKNKVLNNDQVLHQRDEKTLDPDCRYFREVTTSDTDVKGTSCQPYNKDDNDIYNDNKKVMRRRTVCEQEIEAKLKSFIPRSQMMTSDKKGMTPRENERATLVHGVEVTYPEGIEARPPSAKLAAQVMNLPYDDFRDCTVLKKCSSKQEPETIISKFDILRRIKEAYDACTCKVCECISSIATPILNNGVCNCKPCDCNDCKIYKMGGGNHNIALLSKYQQKETLNCKCQPCECEKCKYHNLNKLNNYEPCDCKPCQCDECKSLGINKNRTMIVAAVGEGNPQPYCSCAPCGCFECAHPYGTIAQRTQEMSTGTGVTRPRNCACETCNNANCIQEGANTCNCDRHNKVVRKPVQNENNDYDIRRVMISTILGANKNSENAVDKEDSLVTFDSLFRTFSRDVMENIKRRNDISCQDCTKNNDVIPSFPSNYHVGLRKAQKIPNILDICDCKPCQCNDCKTYHLVEIQPSENCSFNSNEDTISSSFMDSNESSHTEDCKSIQSREPSCCKLCEFTESQKSTKQKHQKVDAEHPPPSMYGKLLSDGYLNHLIYGETHANTRGASPSDHALVKEPKNISAADFRLYKDNTATHSANVIRDHKKNQCAKKIGTLTFVTPLDAKHAVRDRDFETPPDTKYAVRDREFDADKSLNCSFLEYSDSNTFRNSVVVSAPVPKKSTLNFWDSCDSSVHDDSDHLIQSTRKATVEKCMTDVMALHMDKQINFTSQHVAFTNYTRKGNNNIDSLVPRRIQIPAENSLDGRVTNKKPVAGHIIRPKLCKNWNSVAQCDCTPCDCDKCSTDKLIKTSTCKCNCGSCDCYGTCFHPSSVISKDQKTQTSRHLIKAFEDIEENHDVSCNASYHTMTAAAQCLNIEDCYRTNTTNSQEQQFLQQESVVRKNEIKMPGVIRYVPSFGSRLQSSITPQNENLPDRIAYFENVHETLQQAKAYSLGLLNVLRKYEDANREFESISRKLKQSHGTITFQNDIIGQESKTSVQSVENNQLDPTDKIAETAYLDEKCDLKQHKPVTITPLTEDNTLKNTDETGNGQENERKVVAVDTKQVTARHRDERDKDRNDTNDNNHLKAQKDKKILGSVENCNRKSLDADDNVLKCTLPALKPDRGIQKTVVSTLDGELNINKINSQINNKTVVNTLDQELNENKVTTPIKLSPLTEFKDISENKIENHGPVMSKQCIHPENYEVEDEYELIAREMYKSITNTSYTNKISNTEPENILENDRMGISNQAQKTTSDQNKNETQGAVSTKQPSLEFLNILNFIKKFRPRLYDEILKVNSSLYKSTQISEEMLVIKDDDGGITGNESKEIKVEGSEGFIPSFDPIKACAELKKKIITDLYGRIFRVNRICTQYQNQLKTNETVDQKIQSLLDKLLSEERVKKLKEYYYMQSNNMKQSCASKTDKANNFKSINKSNEGIFDKSTSGTSNDGDLKKDVKKDLQLNRRRTASIIYRTEAMALLKEELNKLLDMPLLERLLKSVHSTSELKAKDIEDNKVSNNKALDQRNDASTGKESFEDDDEVELPNTSSPEETQSSRKEYLEKATDFYSIDGQKPTCSGVTSFSSKECMGSKHRSFGGSFVSGKSSKASSASKDMRKINFRTVRKVSDHTIFVRWDAPKYTKDIRGYELLVDGRAVQKLLSPHSCVAVVTCLPHSDRILLTVRSITDGAHHTSSTIVYNRRAHNK